MKQLTLLISCVLLAVALHAQKIPAKPNPPRLVNDIADLLTPDQEAALEQKVVAYNDSTSTQIAVVIVPTLDDYDPVDYAVKLGREWGVGGKEFNNGVIILISTGADGTQRKVFIATGYGMEGAVPDITAQRIVDNELIPYLRDKDYFRGISHAIDAIILAAAGEYKAPARPKDTASRRKGPGILPILGVIFVIIMFIARRGGGGGRGGMMSRRGYRGSVPPIIWFPGGGGGGGGIFGGGGGGGGGGFGGFGGGSFGGGGAGGNW